MTHANHPVESGVVELFAGGLAGLVLGLGTFQLVALLSPLCLLAGSAGACGALSRGPFLLLEAVGIPLGPPLMGVVVVGIGGTVGSTLHWGR